MFKPRSLFIPKVMDASVQVFEKLVFRDLYLLENQIKRSRMNLTIQKKLVLKDLFVDLAAEAVVIKDHDKGGAIVVMDYADYC